jgi:hypothetical protein
MKEKPILFSRPMVQALLNTKPGTWPAEPIDPSSPYKWMTRRIVKPQPDKDDPCIGYCTVEGYQRFPEAAEEIWAQTEKGESIKLKCYSIGDHLWARETFAKAPNGEYIYRADPVLDGCGKGGFARAWTSPIFMPREASRITLEVKGMRVERVQDITNSDALSEGITKWLGHSYDMNPHAELDINEGKNAVAIFSHLWDYLNAKRGYPWENNPYVFVYEFMRV